MSYDALVITAHPDDAETQMGGTLVKLATGGQRILLVDLTEGEPSDSAPRGERARQAAEAARILGVERLTLGHQDRFLADDQGLRLEVAALIREHRPRTVYAIGEQLCSLPDSGDGRTSRAASSWPANRAGW
jgi:LmbE family N-acetylglucosaminyl deacetylase